MRIALVTYAFSSKGGIERTALELARQLLNEGHTVTVFAAHFDADIDLPVAHVHVGATGRTGSLRRSLSFYRQGTRIIRAQKHRFDVVHAMGALVKGADVITAQYCHAAWLRVWPRLIDSRRERLKFLNPMVHMFNAVEGRCYRTASTVTAVSRRTADELAEHHRISRGQIEVIPNGVVLHQAGQDERVRAAMRASLGASEDDTLILLVGSDARGYRRKGLPLLLDALALLPLTSVKLVVAGQGDTTAHEALAKRLGVADRVRFIASAGPIEEVFQAADIFALPTHYEPFGIAIIEAMAVGVPVIVSRMVGVDIEHGTNGLVAQDLHSPQELADLISQIIQDPELRSRLTDNGLAAVKRYGWPAVATEYGHVYRAFVGAHSV